MSLSLVREFRSRLLDATGLVVSQLGVQVLTLLCGLFVVRLLDHDAYAVYTLVGTIIASGVLLCDLGVSAAVTTFAARAEGGTSLGALRGEADWLRRRFTWASLAAFSVAGLVAVARNEVDSTSVAV